MVGLSNLPVMSSRPSQRLTLMAVLIAVGAVMRIGIGNLAANSGPLFGILVKVGLTETLTFVSGYTLGVVPGFIVGASMIMLSDIATLPGAWTPFIAAIIGILGMCAGIIRRIKTKPSFILFGISAVCLTILSEVLQNAWVAVAYNVPFPVTMVTGLSSLVAALINNFVLFTTVGLRVTRIIQHSAGRAEKFDQLRL